LGHNKDVFRTQANFIFRISKKIFFSDFFVGQQKRYFCEIYQKRRKNTSSPPPKFRVFSFFKDELKSRNKCPLTPSPPLLLPPVNSKKYLK